MIWRVFDVGFPIASQPNWRVLGSRQAMESFHERRFVQFKFAAIRDFRAQLRRLVGLNRPPYRGSTFTDQWHAVLSTAFPEFTPSRSGAELGRCNS